MAQYFKDFPAVDYKFGDELTSNQFENIAIYSDVIDQVRNYTSSYINYYILPDERPDQISQKLYGSTDYYWTFFIMNDKLREQGWPLSNSKLYDWAVKNYNERIITTQNVLTDKFEVGKTIQGNTSSASGTIIKRNLDLGQVWVEASTTAFQAGEIVVDTADGSKSVTVLSTENRINTAHHYEKTDASVAGDNHDIDPSAARPTVEAIEKTWMDRLIKENDELKSIVVLKQDQLLNIVNSFKESVSI